MALVLWLFAGSVLGSSVPWLFDGDDAAGLTSRLSQMEQTMQQFQTASKAMEAKYASILSNILKEVNILKNELRALENEHNSTVTELKKVKSVVALGQQKYVLKDIVVHLNETVIGNANSSGKEMQRVRSESSNLSSIVGTFGTDLAAFKSELGILESDNRKISSAISDMQMTLNTTHEDFDKLKQNISTLTLMFDLITTNVSKYESDLAKLASKFSAGPSVGLQNVTQVMTEIKKNTRIVSELRGKLDSFHNLKQRVSVLESRYIDPGTFDVQRNVREKRHRRHTS